VKLEERVRKKRERTKRKNKNKERKHKGNETDLLVAWPGMAA
jgi:hypothetical protein